MLGVKGGEHSFHREGDMWARSWRILLGRELRWTQMKETAGPKAEWSESTCQQWEPRSESIAAGPH